jgi:uncharacterized protein YcfL
MKKLLTIIFILAVFIACQKDEEKTNVTLLTEPIWVSDSLLVNGIDASGAGQLLEVFKGEMDFKKDGTGTFGTYAGTWRFAQNQTQLVIQSPDLPLPISAIIHALTERDLKLSTSFPNTNDPATPLQIRMTFKAR